ncbi:MAG: glycoside hydrolase family 3 C-terminal domain-containing protein [Kiritimatiellales bacterium]
MTTQQQCLGPVNSVCKRTKQQLFTLGILMASVTGFGLTRTPLEVQVTASSELPYETAALAADSDDATFWIPQNSQTNWIQVEFKEPQMVESVQINWSPCVGSIYRLESSLDEQTWTELSRGQKKGPNRAEIPVKQPVEARRLRLTLVGGKWQGLSEIGINGLGLINRKAATFDKPVSAKAPFRDSTLSPEKRAANVVSLMTDYEKHQFVSGYDRFFIRPLKRFGLRAVYLMDATGGVHLRPELDKSDVGSIAYPSTVALAATWNADLARQYGNSVARECRQHGADVLLGPGFNLYRTSTCGRNFEYMGEDPFLTSRMATAYIQGMQKEKVMATAKHFICNNHEWRRHTSDSIVDERTLHEIYMYPWYFVVHEADVACVMTSYNWLNGEKVSQSSMAINGLLKNNIGFDGLVMSDWEAVKDTSKVITSGQDLIMPALHDFASFHCEKNRQTVRNLDRMVTSILTKLFEFGVYDRERKDPAYLSEQGRKECEAIALQTACEAITLLKNDGVLPLKPKAGEPVLVLGPDSEQTRHTGGGSGWVEGYDHKQIGPELLQLLGKDRASLVPWETVADETIAAAPTVVVCVDLNQHEASDQPPMLQDDQEALVKRCVKLNPRTVVVVNSGTGIEMGWSDDAAAVVWAYFGGQYSGQAIAKILTGEVNPSGKLPFTLERKFTDSPASGYRPEGSSWNQGVNRKNPVDVSLPDIPKIFYKEGVFLGYRWYDDRQISVRYPFGYGLSYTTFAYSDMKVETTPDGITVTAIITNSGDAAGAETVQLYVGEKDADVARPVRELKAFAKVHLEPGESRPVSLKLRPIDLAYYDVQQHNWRVQPGKFNIELAASSRDIRQAQTINWEQELRYQRPTDSHSL